VANPAPVGRGLSAASSALAIDGEQAFVRVSAGVYRLEAPLTFATVPALRQPGLERIEAGSGDPGSCGAGGSAAAAGDEVEFDLQQVATSDSAGLALLIDWLAEARLRRRSLRFAQVPEALRALARLSEVESLIAP
jgi:phospholipid transport system transporter-binding protein